jgi:hypothetical protein
LGSVWKGFSDLSGFNGFERIQGFRAVSVVSNGFEWFRAFHMVSVVSKSFNWHYFLIIHSLVVNVCIMREYNTTSSWLHHLRVSNFGPLDFVFADIGEVAATGVVERLGK